MPLGPGSLTLRMTDKWSGTICKMLVECIMRNNSVKLFEFGSVVQESCRLKKILSGALAVLLFGEAEPLMHF